MVYNCTGCETFTLQPLGILKQSENKKNVKFCIPTGPAVNSNCEHCNQRHHTGGPIWSGPIHSKDFVYRVLRKAPERLGTWKRIQGVLSVIEEELVDTPLYFTLERLTSIIHSETPPMLQFRSAILNGGYDVSYAHAHKTSIKTNAPASFIWDIMRAWERDHPVKRERLGKTSPALVILEKEQIKKISFEIHEKANPQSRRLGLIRFQENPTRYWGPGTRATAMVGDQKISKAIRNQGKHKNKTDKRKRGSIDESQPENNKKELKELKEDL